MIQDKIFFDEKDPTGLSYNTPFTYYGSYQGRLWSKSPSGSIKYYTQNSDLSAYATTGSNQFSGSQTITGSLTVTSTITGTVAGTSATASYVEYINVANKPALVSGSSQVTYSGLTGIPSGIVSGSAQVASFGIFATTGSNGFNGSQSITGSLTVTGQVVAQTLNVQQVTSSIVYSSGSNVFGNSLANTQQFTGSVGVTGSLTVAGAGTFSGNVTATGNLNLQGAVTRNINFYDSSNTNINAQIQYDQISSTSGQLFFGTNNAGTFATRLTISNTGAATFSNNVGINGVSPTYPLYVRTGTNQRARFVDNGGLFQFGVLNDAEGAYSDMSLGNSAIMIKSSGNVGIGTTSPDVTGFGWRTLTIKGGTASGEAGVLELQSPATTGAANLGIIAFLDGSNRNAQISGVRDGANNSGALSFVTWNAGTGAERLRIASTGAATFSSSVTLQNAGELRVYRSDNTRYGGFFTDGLAVHLTSSNDPIRISSADRTEFYNAGTERMRITSGGDILLGATSFPAGERMMIQKTEAASLGLDRRGSDGGILRFYQDGLEEGNVTISGTTVSYNGGHLSRWSQTESNERIEGLVKGTVMSNLDQMAVWINPETGEPYENEQLNCIKISDIEGDKNVAGVFVNWDNDDQIYTNDINIAMTGDMIIRIAEGVVVEKGDLLISAGDGTAMPQSDDLIRSNTIAKVTSNHVTCVYEDGSYCVPCVLMAC